jgi:imidazolonepropionase-like amidohydrolase
VGERLGRVEEGHLADLVIVDGDPTADVRTLLDPERVGPVVKGGVLASVPGWAGVDSWARARRTGAHG